MKHSKSTLEFAFKKLLESDHGEYPLEEIAEDPKCPISLLEHLSTEDEEDIRKAVAENRRCPVKILIKLSEDEEWAVRATVAEHKKTPLHILIKLAEDEDCDVVEYAMGNPKFKFTPQLAKKLSESHNESTRGMVASHDKTPANILIKLADDVEHSVRRDVASNNNSPVKALVILIENYATHESGLSRLLLKHPKLPIKYFHDFNLDYERNKLAIADNPRCPVDILQKLSTGQTYEVRNKVALNPNTPHDILWKYATRKTDNIQWYVRNNPNCPPALKSMINTYGDRKDIIELIKMRRDGMKRKDIDSMIHIEETFEDLAFN
jgi:hypothetical protein